MSIEEEKIRDEEREWIEFCKNEPWALTRMAGPSDTALILRAAVYAAEKHKHQKRKDKSGTPYINHPLGVANILSEAGISDVTILIAALCHDLVEDVGVTLDELEKNFGREVAGIVAQVTDDKTLPKADRKRLQVAHAASVSKSAKLVKVADKIYNVRDLLSNPVPNWSARRIQGYIAWSKKVVDALQLSSTIPGSGEVLQKQFDQLLTGTFVALEPIGSSTPFGEKTFAALPPGNLESFVEEYYRSL